MGETHGRGYILANLWKG